MKNQDLWQRMFINDITVKNLSDFYGESLETMQKILNHSMPPDMKQKILDCIDYLSEKTFYEGM